MATQAYARTPYSPTRFPAGITNSNVGDVTANLGQPDPTKFFQDFEDFEYYTAGNWSVGGSPTVAAAAGAGGRITVTIASTEATLRRAVASFAATPGKQIFFKVRFSLADVANTTFWAGLFNASATPANATDGIYIDKPDAVATFNASVRKNATTGANNVTGLGLVADGVMTTLGFWYDGRKTVRFFQDDNLVATLDASSAYLPDADLQLAFGTDDGTGGSNEVATVDYIYCAMER